MLLKAPHKDVGENFNSVVLKLKITYIFDDF